MAKKKSYEKTNLETPFWVKTPFFQIEIGLLAVMDLVFFTQIFAEVSVCASVIASIAVLLAFDFLPWLLAELSVRDPEYTHQKMIKKCKFLGLGVLAVVLVAFFLTRYFSADLLTVRKVGNIFDVPVKEEIENAAVPFFMRVALVLLAFAPVVTSVISWIISCFHCEYTFERKVEDRERKLGENKEDRLTLTNLNISLENNAKHDYELQYSALMADIDNRNQQAKTLVKARFAPMIRDPEMRSRLIAEPVTEPPSLAPVLTHRQEGLEYVPDPEPSVPAPGYLTSLPAPAPEIAASVPVPEPAAVSVPAETPEEPVPDSIFPKDDAYVEPDPLFEEDDDNPPANAAVDENLYSARSGGRPADL